MPQDCKKEDLRIIRTKKACLDALLKLLQHRSFAQLTVNDLCREALISRATFYLHFIDKYDLLKFWLSTVRSELMSEGYAYTELEKNVNGFMKEKTKIISNVLDDTNNETMDILYKFIISFLDGAIEEKEEEEITNKNTVFSNFFAGGIINLLIWQKRNNFSKELQMMNMHLYEIIKCFI